MNAQPYIFLKEYQTPAKEWQDFCHELCNVLLHSDD
ncbi:ImmA/IrrE family metallo-endopeptidase [Metasolibacillus sp.]